MLSHRAKVLIIDDDVTTIRMMADSLTPDYEVIVATAAEEGLHQARTGQPDLILLDVIMPQINGYDVCRRLKADDLTLKIPVIFVTALDAVNQQTKGFELGAVDYITKPIEVALLRARVQSHTRLYQQTLQLESLAATDPLTGLANRRKFDESINHEIERSHRLQTTLSLLIVDIDDFKAYNDHYGHGKGDDCLVSVARLLKKAALRGTDLVSRLGGEEFGIILTDTDRDGAQVIAQHILDLFADAAYPHIKASIHSYLTVSIGFVTVDFAILTDNLPDERAMIDAADKALYQAKNSGRNRFCYESWRGDTDKENRA